jgi:two-component system sensor histidine kinase RegB
MAALDNSQTASRRAVPEWLRASDSRLRLQTIVRLRWIAVLGQSLTVIIAYWMLGMDLPIGGCFAVIALSAWLNVILRIRYPASQRLKSNYAFMRIRSPSCSSHPSPCRPPRCRSGSRSRSAYSPSARRAC